MPRLSIISDLLRNGHAAVAELVSMIRSMTKIAQHHGRPVPVVVRGKAGARRSR